MSDSDNSATTSEFLATPKLVIPAALPLEELPEKRGSAPNTGVHPAPMSMPVPALDRAPPQELRELLQALRDAIRDSGASNDVRLYARFARLVADAFEALLAERDRLQRRALTRGQADILLAVTEGLPEILNDKLIDIVEDR